MRKLHGEWPKKPIAAESANPTLSKHMGLSDLLKSYHALPPGDRAVFAAMVRAHQVFNGPAWKQELARRHQLIDDGRCQSLGEIEALVARLDHANQPGMV